jgi:hypothetical protein
MSYLVGFTEKRQPGIRNFKTSTKIQVTLETVNFQRTKFPQ